MVRRNISNLPYNQNPINNSKLIVTDPENDDALQYSTLEDVAGGGGLPNNWQVLQDSNFPITAQFQGQYIINNNTAGLRIPFAANATVGNQINFINLGNQIYLGQKPLLFEGIESDVSLDFGKKDLISLIYVGPQLGWIASLKNYLTVVSLEFVPVTKDMILSATWNTIGESRTDLSGNSHASLLIDFEYTKGDTGIIFESGGDNGIILYAHNDLLKYSDLSTTYTFPDSELNLSGNNKIEISFYNGQTAFYSFGNLISIENINSYSGGNAGGIGQVYNGYYANNAPNGLPAYSNTINKVDIFINQHTPDLD